MTRAHLHHFLDPALHPLNWSRFNVPVNAEARTPAGTQAPTSGSTQMPDVGTINAETGDRRSGDEDVEMSADAQMVDLHGTTSPISMMESPNICPKQERQWPEPPPLSPPPLNPPPIASLPTARPLTTYLVETISAIEEGLKNGAFREMNTESVDWAIWDTLAQVVNVEAKIEMDLAREVETINQESFNVQLSSRVGDDAFNTKTFPKSVASSIKGTGQIHPAALLTPNPIDNKSGWSFCLNLPCINGEKSHLHRIHVRQICLMKADQFLFGKNPRWGRCCARNVARWSTESRWKKAVGDRK